MTPYTGHQARQIAAALAGWLAIALGICIALVMVP